MWLLTLPTVNMNALILTKTGRTSLGVYSVTLHT